MRLPVGRLQIRTLSQAAESSESLFLATDKSFAQTNFDVTSSLLLPLSLLHLLQAVAVQVLPQPLKLSLSIASDH